MQAREMTDQEFQHHALSILQRELGAEGFARFLRLYRSGRGDYTKERHQLLKGVTIDEVIEQIRSRETGDQVKHSPGPSIKDTSALGEAHSGGKLHSKNPILGECVRLSKLRHHPRR